MTVMPGEHWDVNPATVNEFLPQSNGAALLEGIDTSGGTKFEFFDWYVPVTECAYIDRRSITTSCKISDKQAVWDWKDTYSVATAKCTIKVSSEQICIDDYSYYVAGR